MDASIYSTPNIIDIGQSSSGQSPEELLPVLKAKLSEILVSEFKSGPKTNIKNERSGLQFACPFCGDSYHNPYKKRAHITLRGKFAGYFKCYNCGKFVSIPKFYNHFEKSLPLDTITSVNTMTQDVSANGRSGNITIDSMYDMGWVEEHCRTLEEFAKHLNLVQVTQHPRPMKYLKDRCIHYDYKRFLYDAYTDSLVIVNLTPDDRVVGFQIRDLSGKRKVKYTSYNATNMLRNVWHDTTTEVPDEIDRMSLMFNIYNVDISRPVIVTEGPIDSFFLPNAIALSGANKSFDGGLEYWFLFDSDATGNKRAMEMLNKGHKVFLWSKLKSDFLLPKRKKWDVNDVMIYVHQHRIGEYQVGHISWEKYFSDNQMDLILI